MSRRELLTDPVALTVSAFFILLVASQIGEPEFEPGRASLILLAAALEVPCAFWARLTARDLKVHGARCAGLLLLSWLLPVSLYGLVAGPTWIVIAANQRDLRFGLEGVGLCIATLGLPGAFLIVRRRRAMKAAG